MTDRSEGGSSLVDGQLELMLHRRSFVDDFFGVDEALNEPGSDGRGLVARGRHWLVLGSPESVYRPLAMEMFYEPMMTFAPLTLTHQQYRSNYRTQFTGLRRSLPEHVNLMTTEQLDQRNVLVRFEHLYQGDEDPNLAMPVNINLDDVFDRFEITAVTEMMLGGNREAGMRRVNFENGAATFTLHPMEIKTFRLDVRMKN